MFSTDCLPCLPGRLLLPLPLPARGGAGRVGRAGGGWRCAAGGGGPASAAAVAVGRRRAEPAERAGWARNGGRGGGSGGSRNTHCPAKARRCAANAERGSAEVATAPLGRPGRAPPQPPQEQEAAAAASAKARQGSVTDDCIVALQICKPAQETIAPMTLTASLRRRWGPRSLYWAVHIPRDLYRQH